jgi:predicted alpha/beta-fold hydrolase
VPLVPDSTYRPPALLRDGHSLTVFPTLSRRVTGIEYRRERVELPDGDFLDVDWSRVGADRVAVISHGLEGCASRPYVLGMVRAFNRAGWDVAAWNFRGCSGESNRTLTFTHSGASGDLGAVVDAVLATGRYREMALIGFSLGGNLTLKYLGERGAAAPAEIRSAVAFSVPCDLEGAADQMGLRSNWVYMRRFLTDLRERMTRKAAEFPGRVTVDNWGKIRTFREFDERYTAPLHGFAGAVDYWNRSSSRGYLAGIRRPVLLVNAQDDPFLSPGCFPTEAAAASEWVHLESPVAGGHVGFVSFGEEGEYWSERRAREFVEEQGKRKLP